MLFPPCGMPWMSKSSHPYCLCTGHPFILQTLTWILYIPFTVFHIEPQTKQPSPQAKGLRPRLKVSQRADWNLFLPSNAPGHGATFHSLCSLRIPRCCMVSSWRTGATVPPPQVTRCSDIHILGVRSLSAESGMQEVLPQLRNLQSITHHGLQFNFSSSPTQAKCWAPSGR